MKFGLFGGPGRFGGEQNDQEAYQRYVDQVVEAEALGFYGAYCVEHHFTGVGQVSSSLTVLSHVAAHTSTIRLGTAVVVVPWHNPILLAEQVATLDVLSQGRFDLGLGRGYRDYEFRGFGVEPTDAPRRFDEAVQVLLAAWTSDGRFSHHGEHWDFEDVVIEPSPIQKPHPPLWTGAGSPPSIEKAASQGFRLFLDQVGTFDTVAKRIEIYRAAREAVGLSYDPSMVAVTRALRIARSASEREEKLELHMKALDFLAKSAGKKPVGSGGSNPFYSPPEERRATAEASGILGTPEECIERLHILQEGGVDQVLFSAASVEDMRFFAKEVMPAFEPSDAPKQVA